MKSSLPLFAPSQNPSNLAPGCPLGVLAEAARLIPRSKIVLPSFNRKCASLEWTKWGGTGSPVTGECVGGGPIPIERS